MKAVVLSLLSIILVNCGGSGDSSPLSPQEKEAFGKFLRSMSRPGAIAGAVTSKGKNQQLKMGFSQENPDEENSRWEKMDEIVLKNCTAKIGKNPGGMRVQKQNSFKMPTIEVSGEHCPILYVTEYGEVEFDQSGMPKGPIKMKMTFKVIDEEFKKLSEIIGFEIAGSTLLSPNKVNLKMNGTTQSLVHNNVGVAIAFEILNKKGAVELGGKVNYDFSASPVIKKMVVVELAGSIGNPRFKINGEEYSLKQFRELAGNAFEGFGGGLGQLSPQSDGSRNAVESESQSRVPSFFFLGSEILLPKAGLHPSLD